MRNFISSLLAWFFAFIFLIFLCFVAVFVMAYTGLL